jgi:ubiquinone/menaquinone biosynthesis C-methylase UbiE
MLGRKRALSLLALKPGERVLIVGVGTGADLPFLPADVDATGIDISPEMLAKARLILDRCPAAVKFIQGDAQTLLVDEASFDAAILNLILSVIPDGNACLQSALRSLKPGGRAAIIDKFLPEVKKSLGIAEFYQSLQHPARYGYQPPTWRPMKDCPCDITHDEASIAGGLVRVVMIKKR